MKRHRLEIFKEASREKVEKALVSRFKAIKSFEPLTDHLIVDRFKDGTYGLSNAGFALYSNGHNVRGKSSFAPFGLFFHDEKCLFSIGYFKREGEPTDKPGYLIFVSPRGKDVETKVNELVQEVLASDLEVAGVYIRYLKLDQFIHFLNMGYKPVKEHPWHPEAPEEDENLCHSVVDISKIIDGQGNILNLDVGTKNHKRNFRLHINRFANFLIRNRLDYTLRNMTEDDAGSALEIIRAHFAMLRKHQKDIGSTAEDHINSISKELLSLETVDARIGFLEDVPVSLFIYEKLGDSRVGLYTTFTLRDRELILPRLGLEQSDLTGFSAMPIYAYSILFRDLLTQSIEVVHMGGSEHPDLNLIKRHMGGELDPTYWVVKLKE